MRLLALLLIVACAHGPMRPPVRAGEPGAKLVSWMWNSPGVFAWRQGPWYRPDEDLGTPMRVVVSTDAYACVLGMTSDEPLPSSYYVCASGWRYPRATR